MGFLYILKHNKKLYVGQTGDIKSRFRCYKKDYKNHNIPIHNAIRKYGWENFDKIIFSNIPTELLDYFEIELIKRLNTISPNGYNLECGGHKNKKLHKDTIEKIRKVNIGKKRSIESRKKMSEARIGKYSGKNHPMYGKHHSEETIKKLSVSHIGLMVGNKHPLYGIGHSDITRKKMSKSQLKRFSNGYHISNKKVICVETGEVYQSINDAQRKTSSKHISMACCGKIKTSGGYHWKHYE